MGWVRMCAAGVLAALVCGESAARASVASVEATPVAGVSAVRLDGALSDDVWTQARVASGFLQREPTEGAPATFETEVRVAYDAAYIYVAVRALDPEPSKARGLLTRRDTQSPSDWISVLIDSYHDRRTAFEFAVNPAGVKRDSYWFNDYESDPSWDAVWDAEVTQDERGWQAEFRIPLSQLRFHPRANATFGFAVVRQIARLNETSSWPVLPRSANGYVSSFGELTGLQLTAPLRRLELVPYTVGQVTTERVDGNPFRHSPDAGTTVGLDFKYALKPGLTLTGTVNPDFGQVEADPAVVNLTAFETFFAERRPFFVEGSGVFRFDLDCEDDRCSGLFYSRRIGRTPQVEIEEPEDGHIWSPAHTTILGATKVTGRAGGLSLGVLNAVTAEERGGLAASDGTRTSPTVEPFTSYSLVRARREFRNQSSLGFMTTATNRRIDGTGMLLPSQAYSGGIDVDWRLSSRYRLSGYSAGSFLRGDAAAIEDVQTNNRHAFQRPDARHVSLDPNRRSLGGMAGQVGLAKIGGERVRFNTYYTFKTPGFEINDLGFLRRADTKDLGAWLQWRRDRPSRRLRSFRINFNHWHGWNFDGDRTSLGGNVNAHAMLTNNWRMGSGVTSNAQVVDDRFTRGGPSGYLARRVSAWGYVESDNRGATSVAVNASGMRARDGSSYWDVNPTLVLRPAAALSFSAGVRFAHEINDAQWIENVAEGGDHHVFGHLDQKTAALTFRTDYTAGPSMSIQLYAEPFVSAGAYTDLKELVDGRAARYADRFASYAYTGTPDFRYRSFRTTNVFRWEYRPGSALFIVWQQSREADDETGDFRFGRDLGRTFAAPGTNVFLVKLAYWINR